MRAFRWHHVHLEVALGPDQPVLPTSSCFARCGPEATPAGMLACSCLVFVIRNGTRLGARNVQRDFRKVIDSAGLPGREWTPRELRQSFVSLRPVIEGSADVMDRLFPTRPGLKP